MSKIAASFAPLRLGALVLALACAAFAQNAPAPKDVFGFTPGDDRKLASWAQIVDYFRRLDAASDRVAFHEIGKTTLERPFVYATISTPENLSNLAKYKEINKKLADPRRIKSDDKTARQLIRDGKTIVLITCGIHSTEVGSTLSSTLIAHRLATDPAMQKVLENTIVLLVPSLNPDGVDIVKNWYDKTLGTPFEGTTPPELYHKYTGHDNNRDWYAFTQIETQLTVDKLHNEWHPQIVHDIHQQGANGARMFLPPYLPPVEPNVPREIVEGFTELGGFMANDLRKQGLAGITTNSTYDAWTPARAYSHYHGGVRILSETASARLASPVDIKFDALRGDLGYDAKKESKNFAPVWPGGDWKLADITRYMTTAAFSLLRHASDNRERWLTRFYAIGKEAVRPRAAGENFAYVIDAEKSYGRYTWALLDILRRGGVETKMVGAFTYQGRKFNDYTVVVPAQQPYAAFAKALLEPQGYPNLLDEKNQPITPYDVTAHNLALLTGTAIVKIPAPFEFKEMKPVGGGYGTRAEPMPADAKPKMLYKSHVAAMDEGWTRWVFDQNKWRIEFAHGKRFSYQSVTDRELRAGDLFAKTDTIIFPDQSANQILNGHRKGSMPDELTGGVGAEGVENLRKFVEAGGTLVFLNRASDFAIEQFKLPVRDVAKGLPRKEFFIPGSILRIELDAAHPLAKGMPAQSIAWFEDSPAFEIQTDPLALANNFRIVARYPSKTEDILLSGWALGAEKLAGKAALVEFTVGKGKIVLFGFRPQYRGQSLATFPLLFNAVMQ